MRARWLPPVFALALLALGVFFMPHLPAHFNARGHVGGTRPRLVAIARGPIVILLIWFAALLLPRLDPRGNGYTGFIGTYWFIFDAVTGFLALAFVLLPARAAGWVTNPERFAAAFALLLPRPANVAATLAVIAVSVLIPVVYSLVHWQHRAGMASDTAH